MTDNRTTELLRKLLEERGVEYEAEDMQTNMQTYWGDWCFMEPLDAKPHTIGAQCELMLIPATPEQAIAATLGAHAERTCEWQLEHSGTLYDKWRCSECGYLFVESRTDHGIKEDFEPNYCPNCGSRVIE